MKKFMMVFAALSLLLISCEKEKTDKPQAATLEIDAPASITFNADGTGGMEVITVTTNQSEWSYALTPVDDAGQDGWLEAVKEGNQLKLTVKQSTLTVEPADIKITFTTGDAPEKTTTAKLLPADEPVDDGIYSVDDLWPNDENPEGIVFWIDPASSEDGGITGTTGWVMSLKQAPELPWSSNRMEVDFGTNSDIDGRLNWEAIWAFDVANPEFTGTFQIFKWCRENYDEQWYIPSLQEMRRFLAVYAGLTPEQTETYMLGRRLSSLDTIFGSGTWFGTEEHRKAYDMNLIEIGADPLWDWNTTGGSADPQLWTSTKYDVDIPAIEVKPWYVGFLGDWGSASTQGQHDGHLTRAMRRFGVETIVDALSVNPANLTFGADEATSKSVNVTKTATEYNATVSAPWVHISKTADSFSVSVDEYTEDDAALDNFVNRVAWITVASGNAPAVTVTVTQVAPVTAPIDLAGTWNWTGEIWSFGTFTAQSGTLEAVYDEVFGYWILSTLPENQAMTDLLGGPRIDGGVAFNVTESNIIEFIVKKPIGIYFDLWAMGSMFRGYYNYATFFDAAGSNIAGVSGLFEDTNIQIDISTDGNTITFPTTGTYEGSEYTYGFGFGYMDIVSLEDTTISPTSSDIQPGGIYRNLVFTRTDN